MGALAVVGSVSVYFRMTLGVAVPLVPGSPVALIAIAVSSMVVMLVATVLLVGVFSVATILAVVVPSVMAIVTDGGAMIFLPVAAAVVCRLLVSMALLVLLRLVPSPMIRSFFPVVGKTNTGEAKGYDGNDADDVRLFHWFPPILPE